MMSRLIDADILKKSIIESRNRCYVWISDCDEAIKPRVEQAMFTFNECIMRINEQPTIEPEIIRCEDCGHSEGSLHNLRCGRFYGMGGYHEFCSRAERKEGE